jgi:hypothetical protein
MMLVVAFDSLLHGSPGEVLDFRSTVARAGGCAAAWSVVTVCGSPCVLENGAKEGDTGFGVAVFPEEYLDDLSILIEGTIDVSPAPGHFDISFLHGERGPTPRRCAFAAS